MRELVEHLKDQNRTTQSDCVKALYEIGGREPGLIAPFADEFIDQVSSSNNRMVWGAMTALGTIASVSADAIWRRLIAFLGKCIPRDVAKHAESMLVAVHDGNREEFVRALKAREKALKPSQMARLKKVYRALAGGQTR